MIALVSKGGDTTLKPYTGSLVLPTRAAAAAGISAECTAVDVQVRADMYCADRRFERRTA